MLVSDGPSNFNLWGNASVLFGGDEMNDSDDFSISVERFYDILNEDQSQNPSTGNVDVSSMEGGFLIPEFPEMLSDDGAPHDPWSLPSVAGQTGFNPLYPACNLEFPILRGNNGMEHSLLSLETNDKASDANIDPMNEGTLNGTLETDGKHLVSLVSSDGFGRFADAYTEQIYDEDMLNRPQQVDLKPLVNHGAGSSNSDWLSLSALEQDMCVKSTIETTVFPVPTQGDNNHWANGSLGHVGSSNLDVEDLLSDSACVVDLTVSDSDDEVLLDNMKNGLPFHVGVEQVARGLTCNLVSQDFQHSRSAGSNSEHHSTYMKKESVFLNCANASMSRSKYNSDSVPFIRESSGIFSVHASQNLQLSSTNLPGSSSNDADVYIVEDASDQGHPSLMTVQNKALASSQPSIFGDSFHRVGPGEERVKSYDEKLTYRLALQDLSQPRKEASPPDGVLAVPLLRHQRIALSWMLHKETASLHCSGGILADDQGLGKTVSMIALILMEKSPSLKTSSQRMVDIKPEPLDLDEDDGAMVPQELKQTGNSEGGLSTKSFGSESTASTCKRRPAAGTLVVCPTSVLRQWAEELQNKVAEKAKLSVLIYHGSNRTRDPDELAKYDVVLTTYSIVSMEVPKQPLVDQDNEKGNDVAGGLSLDSFSGIKRKHDHNDKNKKKKKKVAENSETLVRPLARVGWFRVILDEAQSIKNHRTQVARACWGLRAKRRWCLSGTPIQNAIDDLYSYFRFLRYDPYAVYKSFCTTIKNPISRSPTTGYKKLQAVLQTIMLRRTKGTILDGEPIIKLPPKSVSLKKVDFSMEERDYYSRLEVVSREQFKVYADAGTVKQNYVNILLMLLRLRQACDHPKLVKGFDSTAVQRFSLESAKQLPREKREELLNHLEACLSLCGICNDPPEDAVVTNCSHVFCNQCICERFSGDENICPAAHCKNQINISSVFSRSTLKSSLLDETTEHNISDASGCEHVRTAEKSSDFPSIESSKIRAALDILQTLPEVQQPDSHRSSAGRTCDSVIEGCRSEQNSKPLRVTEKAIVFSQWTRMLDLLEVPLKNSCINYRRLDGTMSVQARDKAVKDFNSLPEALVAVSNRNIQSYVGLYILIYGLYADVSVMIMSLKAASLGLNMVAACHVLLLDLWWNPTTEDQAIDRAHRIGQTRPVFVTRLTVKDTVEDRILALQEKKRVMVASAFGEDERGGRQTRLTEDDLKYLFMI